VSEGALHAFSLAGGFFGALVAQRVLRHKRRKRGFMVVYWMTVGVHAVGWVAAWWVVSGGG
jgi:uncharacterized membrane protein YsdA (DUF1294 family)